MTTKSCPFEFEGNLLRSKLFDRVADKVPRWGAADLIAPNKDVGKWNLALLDFGALVCKAPNPD